ncbi:glycosyltransferase family 39 protein [Candidatus Curtissbacteria bacterium]|nr:glycosyltransferase family 39 protein [Candidatus Curtissbacteria bacterium]
MMLLKSMYVGLQNLERTKVLLIFILVASFLLRVWHGQDFFFWHIDEEMLSLTTKRILVEHRPQLIGFPIPGGLYLGPLMYYIIAASYGIVGMNPSYLPLIAAIFGTITVFLVYRIGRDLFGERIALIASAIYGFSYLVNVYSRLFTGLTFVPILSLCVYFFIYKLVKTQSQKYFLLLGLTLLVAVQNEGSSLSLLLLAFICYLKFKYTVRIKPLLFLIFLFVVSHLPLFIFNLRHNNYLVGSFITFVTREKSAHLFSPVYLPGLLTILPSTFSRIFYIGGNLNISDQILPCPSLLTSRQLEIPLLLTIICAFVLLVFIFKASKKGASIGYKIVLYHLLIALAGIAFYNLFLPGYLYEWILVVLFPGLVFVAAVFLGTIRRDYLIPFLSFSFVVFTFINVWSLAHTNSNFGLKNKMDAVSYVIGAVGDKPFELRSTGDCYQNGYIYLFWQKGKLPVKSYEDERFSSTLDLNPSGNITPQMTATIVSPTLQNPQIATTIAGELKKKTSLYKSFGEIKVFITN